MELAVIGQRTKGCTGDKPAPRTGQVNISSAQMAEENRQMR